MIRGIIRLIEGLSRGDPEAIYVLAFASVGAAVIYLGVQYIRRKKNL
jgi:hypothetical protein